MAFFTDTQNRHAGLIERAADALSHWLADVSETLARRRLASETYSELSQLGDRELHDLGMTRADLCRVAREAAREKL